MHDNRLAKIESDIRGFVRRVGLVRCVPRLMDQGAFCDRETFYNAATKSRLKMQYWQRKSHGNRI
jgi:hypothetical protein